MTTESKEKPEQYQQALDWAEAGEHDKALEYVQSYLEGRPDDAEALNDAGTLLWGQGRSEEALAYVEKARQLEADSPAILWNLFEIYLSMGQGTDAVKLFDDMERQGILQVDALNRAATVLIDSGDLSDAMSTLNRSLALEPRQAVLEPIIEVLRHKQGAAQEAVS